MKLCQPDVLRVSHVGMPKLYRVPTHVYDTERFLLWTGCCGFQVEYKATHWHPPLPCAICVEYGCDWTGGRSRAFHFCRWYGSLSKVRCSSVTGPLITPNINLKTSSDVTNGLCPQFLSLSHVYPSISVFRAFLPLLFLSFFFFSRCLFFQSFASSSRFVSSFSLSVCWSLVLRPCGFGLFPF
jgi:hypothetical protein